MEKKCILISNQNIQEFEQFLYERENAEATIRKYKTDLHTFLGFLGKNREVDKERVLAYKNWLISQYAVSSVNSMLAALNQFFKFLDAEFLKVKRIRTQTTLFLREEKELSKKEYLKLLRTARMEGKTQLALCMETIAATGVRVSELEHFTVEHVKQGKVEVFNKGKYRRIFLPSEIRKKLLRFCKSKKIIQGPIFRGKNGKPKDRSVIWSEMKALKEKSGVTGEKIFPHNLRHLFARIYYQYTKDLAGLADLLGHSSLSVTRIYTSNTGKVYQKQLDDMVVLQI